LRDEEVSFELEVIGQSQSYCLIGDYVPNLTNFQRAFYEVVHLPKIVKTLKGMGREAKSSM